MPGAPRSAQSSGRRVLSANRTLTRRPGPAATATRLVMRDVGDVLARSLDTLRRRPGSVQIHRPERASAARPATRVGDFWRRPEVGLSTERLRLFPLSSGLDTG